MKKQAQSERVLRRFIGVECESRAKGDNGMNAVGRGLVEGGWWLLHEDFEIIDEIRRRAFYDDHDLFGALGRICFRSLVQLHGPWRS
jgi:hypothetical protein